MLLCYVYFFKDTPAKQYNEFNCGKRDRHIIGSRPDILHYVVEY